MIKDDTLPCKRQALAWQKEPKAWTQALQRYKQVFISRVCSKKFKYWQINYTN